ncbi:MAG: family 20 glycosylhydrolase [bacterium]|nr:family 20 glycosylhydrolase [bacterium]
MSWQLPASLSPLPRRWLALPGKLPARRFPLPFTWLDSGAAGAGLAAEECRRVEAHLARRGLVQEGGADHRLQLVHDAGQAVAACRLRLDSGGARLEAGGEAGFHRGVELLAALTEAEELPALELEDEPCHAWRGLMLDCARHFWPVPVVERILDELAHHGFNLLHLHLTDDQGWRLPLPGRPELAAVAAWRTEPDGSRHGGCYTAEELRGLVATGRELGVEILPEVDLPGHCGALLAAIPALSCDGLPREVPRAWGCHNHVLCLGRPESLAFLEELLDGLTTLFPFPIVHLGGDEISPAAWAVCPRCRELARREGLAPTGLAAWWLRQAAPRLAAVGRRGAFWDEALEAGVPADALIFAWRGDEAVRRSLAAGHETVACPQDPCYLDHYPDRAPGQARAIGGHNPWQALRAFDPALHLPPAASGRLLGAQGNLWTEYVATEALLMERLQPRLAALMEALWHGPEEAEGEGGLARRLPKILQRQRERGWSGRVDPPAVEGAPLAKPGEEICLILRATLPGARLEAWLEEDPATRWAPAPGASPDRLPLRLVQAAGRRQTLLARQVLPGGLASRPVPVPLRWEDALAAREVQAADGPAVACRWLRAPHADWARVQVDEAMPPWWTEDLDWPVAAVVAHLARVREGTGRDETEEDLVAPPPAGVGLRRECLLRAEQTGPWRFRIFAHSPARLWLDGHLVADHDGFAPGDRADGMVGLAAGWHHLRLDWLDLRGGACRLEARGPADARFLALGCRLARQDEQPR